MRMVPARFGQLGDGGRNAAATRSQSVATGELAEARQTQSSCSLGILGNRDLLTEGDDIVSDCFGAWARSNGCRATSAALWNRSLARQTSG